MTMDDHQDNDLFQASHDEEGIFDIQLTLPFPGSARLFPIRQIVKRDGRLQPFDREKIVRAILRAVPEGCIMGNDIAESISSAVDIFLSKQINDNAATADQVSDAVERVLIHMSQAEVALSYARYRDRRARIRRLRKGDMSALLSEIEEARFDENSALAKDSPLHVQTSQDRIVKWDRNRIVAALQLETDMDAGLANIIALEVEQQIHAAGISILTASLIRELVGVKLLEHGLSEENDLRRRLGVPLYDASQIIRGCTPETMNATPRETDLILARAVKKEYAFAEIFSAPVTQAHLLGQIHLNHVAEIDRLHSSELIYSEYLKSDAMEKPDGTAADTTEFVGRLMRYYEYIQEYFQGALTLPNFNFMAAPFLYEAEEETLHSFCKHFIRECAHRASFGMPLQISLRWNSPASAQDSLSAFEHTPDRKTLETTARRIFSVLLDSLHAGDEHGNPYPAPIIDIHLDKKLFQTFEGNAPLNQAVRTALSRPQVRFVLSEDDKEAVPPTSAYPFHAQHIIWHRVSLNLPQAAAAYDNEADFRKELERLCRLIVQAQVEKGRFLESMLDKESAAPLSVLARSLIHPDDLSIDKGLFLVDVDGLYECAEIVHGTESEHFNQRIAFMGEILSFLGLTLHHYAESAGILCRLSANTNPGISQRFAHIDAGFYPLLLDSVIKINQDQTLSYTPGIGLPPKLALNPVEIARIAGQLCLHLDEPAITRLSLPEQTSEQTLGSLLKKIFLQTHCKAIGLQGKTDSPVAYAD
ncbi:MAG: hypothetical protein GX117_05175 [Candidatus Hydrogenedentes bacterium]|nr:hypothetical protein [Candidatus Hydrogenedentota bacterium]